MDSAPHPFSLYPFTPEIEQAARELIRLGLQEDLQQRGDVTSNLLIDEQETGSVVIRAREQGRLSGLPLAPLVFEALEARCQISETTPDGSLVEPGQAVATLTGPVRALLTAERTILNFMTHLSGIATLTSTYVEKTQGTAAKILDTRKTHPGFRLLEKYAVLCGGGTNHRIGLYDGVMIKDNHLAARRAHHPQEDDGDVIRLVRQVWPELPLTLEVDTLAQLRSMLPAGPDVVLLDNMTLEQLREAVKIRDSLAPQTELEASGGVNLQTVADIAATGVDRISVGALTHSAPAFDLGFDWSA